MTELIYCAAGNERLARTAIRYGYTYGAQLPATTYAPVQFVDQNWKNPDRAKYMAALAQHKPRLATVLDWEQPEQLDEVLSWADEAAQHVTEAVIIIPKVFNAIHQLPQTIRGKQVRLGYSVPTKFGATSTPVWEFCDWPVHLLGGAPQNQLKLAQYMQVASADGNYATKMSNRWGQFFTNGAATKAKDRYWPKMSDYHRIDEDMPYRAWELSCINIKAAWAGCKAVIRFGTEQDIPAIKRVANQFKNELGFVNSAALKTSAAKLTLFVAELHGEIVGFCNQYHRRDGWATVYEIAVDRRWQGMNIGAGLLCSVPRPYRLKCTVDNPANSFYAAQGLILQGTEQGKKRTLNVWESGHGVL